MTGLGQRLKDWVLLILCNLIWASQFVMVKLVQREMGPVFATFLPMTLATLILMPIAWCERRRNPAVVPSRVSWRDLLDFCLLGVLGQVVAQLFTTWGSRLTLASNGSLLQLTLPIATGVMAWFFLRERMSRLRAVSFLFAIAGVLVTSLSAPAKSEFSIDWHTLDFRHSEFLWGNLLIFLGVNGSAFYNVYSKSLLTRYSPLQVLLRSYYVVFAFLLPITLWFEPSGFVRLPEFGRTVWIGLILLTVFQYSLSMVIVLHVLVRLDAMQAGLMNYLLPFLGVVIAWAVLGETLTVFMLFGGLLALGSTLLATVFDKTAPAEEIAETGACKLGESQ
jgi:drug/metabolite transporter (DMT)-like permease